MKMTINKCKGGFFYSCIRGFKGGKRRRKNKWHLKKKKKQVNFQVELLFQYAFNYVYS